MPRSRKPPPNDVISETKGGADAAALRQHAVSLLARRDHARAELCVKLKRKLASSRALRPLLEADSATVMAILEEVLDWCSEHDFLNDRRFAGSFVRSRIERGQGAMRIRADLKQRGVDAEVVDEALRQASCDWFALAASTLQRRFHTPPADVREKARMLRFLQSRGFDAEQSHHALACLDVDQP